MSESTPHANANAHTLIVLGSGGHAAVVTESARRAGFAVIAVASRDSIADEAVFRGVEALGDPDGAALTRIGALVARGAKVIAAVGDPALRARWFDHFGAAACATIIDPSAVISASAYINAGVFIAPRAVVNARARVERGCIVNTAAIVEHDCRIGAFAHIAPGAVLCGTVEVGAWTHIGAGAVVVQNRAIGARVMIGAGAVVIRDVAADCTAVGVPATLRADSPHHSR